MSALANIFLRKNSLPIAFVDAEVGRQEPPEIESDTPAALSPLQLPWPVFCRMLIWFMKLRGIPPGRVNNACDVVNPPLRSLANGDLCVVAS